VVLLLITGGFYWSRDWNGHIFPQLSLTYYCGTTQPIWSAFNFTIYGLKQVYTADQTISTLWSDTNQCSATALNIALN
jgi:hypothetical protein